MPTDYEKFWEKKSFAVVGHSGKKGFPKWTYQGLKKLGKTVFPVDCSVDFIEGDKTFSSLGNLPEKVEAVVLEVPKEETKEWVEKTVEAGVKDLWIHMNTDTPEAVELAKEKGLNVTTGTCAVMYVTPGLSFHSIHKWINKCIGKF